MNRSRSPTLRSGTQLLVTTARVCKQTSTCVWAFSGAHRRKQQLLLQPQAQGMAFKHPSPHNQAWSPTARSSTTLIQAFSVARSLATTTSVWRTSLSGTLAWAQIVETCGLRRIRVLVSKELEGEHSTRWLMNKTCYLE